MVRKVALVLATALAVASWSVITAGATGSWSIVPSPNGVGQFGAELTAVSCLSPSACVAVGSMQDPLLREATLIESFDGSRWTRQPSPNAAGLQQNELEAVSCTSASWCLAVGNAGDGSPNHRRLAERWDGSHWSIEVTPAPSGPEQTEFHGVACVSVSNCTIVGESITASVTYALLIEHWNGTSWSIASTATPAGVDYATLSSVACGGPSDCIAVGESNKGAITEHWNGTSWSFVSSPLRQGATWSGLSDVTCTSASNCIAVGGDDVPGPLVERWGGSSWQVMSAPAGGVLQSVSCATSTDCVAVGPSDEQSGFAEHYDGVSWSQTPTPPTGDWAWLNGVACVSATSCTAVGGTWLNPGTSAEAERWNGSSWSTLGTIDQTGELPSTLAGIACAAATNCVAVGTFGVYDEQPLAEGWNGAAWSLQQARTPTGANTSRLAGVACPSTSRCIAVGSYGSDSEHVQPLAEIWNGSKWSLQTARKPSGTTTSSLDAVACPSTTVCFAVGTAYVGDAPRALVERWDGSTWTIQTVAPLGGNGTPALYGITCLSTSNCIAVGDAIERWNGSTWAIQTSPNDGSLTSVTCTSASNCFAVSSAGRVGAPLIEHWNGSAWAVQTSTVDNNEVHFLTGVACISATDCNAVGNESDRDTLFPIGFVDHWNGTAWSTSRTLAPPSNLDAVNLAGIACVAGRCTAVGNTVSYEGGGNITYIVSSSATAAAPGAPTLTGYRAGNGWVSVAWDPPASSGDSPVRSYVVTTSPGGQTVTVPADARRAVVAVPNGQTQTAHVQAVNDAGPSVASNDSAAFTPAASTIKITTKYNAADNTRLLKNAAYFGQSATDAQRTSVGILAYLVGISHLPAMTPISPPASTGPNSYTTSWSATDQSALVSVMGQYGLMPNETQLFSVQLVGYLLALGGH